MNDAIRSILRCAALGALLAGAAPARASLNCNPGVEFHPDGGGVKSCDLNGVHALSTRAGLTVHCANGERAELARDGRLRECTLARPLEANGRRCAAGERIELDEAGRIRTCERR